MVITAKQCGSSYPFTRNDSPSGTGRTCLPAVVITVDSPRPPPPPHASSLPLPAPPPPPRPAGGRGGGVCPPPQDPWPSGPPPRRGAAGAREADKPGGGVEAW